MKGMSYVICTLTSGNATKEEKQTHEKAFKNKDCRGNLIYMQCVGTHIIMSKLFFLIKGDYWQGV
jgi:hypothetical protein